jgi:hypothetical protein
MCITGALGPCKIDVVPFQVSHLCWTLHTFDQVLRSEITFVKVCGTPKVMFALRAMPGVVPLPDAEVRSNAMYCTFPRLMLCTPHSPSFRTSCSAIYENELEVSLTVLTY